MGALLSTLSAQTIVSTTLIRQAIIFQIASVHTPTFQDLNMLLEYERRTRIHERRFKVGIRGNVGSILVSW